MNERLRRRRHRPLRMGTLALAALSGLGLTGFGPEAMVPTGTLFYSTAAAPETLDGPAPAAPLAQEPAQAAPAELPTRVASNTPDRAVPPPPTSPPAATATAEGNPAADPIATSLAMIDECKERYTQIRDYTCTFYKRERHAGRITAPHIMAMKLRSQPFSVYMKFVQPNPGREAIFITGRNNGKVVVHDVGIGKLLAGTMYLDPRGSMAMDENLHPVTDAGIGHLIDTVHSRWHAELKHGESLVEIHPDVRVNDRPCTMIQSIHPQKHANYLFHKVKVYIDRELGVPIRFEAYDWPRRAGETPELVEEYTYLNLRLNPGLREVDFDPRNKAYSYGRF